VDKWTSGDRIAYAFYSKIPILAYNYQIYGLITGILLQ